MNGTMSIPSPISGPPGTSPGFAPGRSPGSEPLRPVMSDGNFEDFLDLAAGFFPQPGPQPAPGPAPEPDPQPGPAPEPPPPANPQAPVAEEPRDPVLNQPSAGQGDSPEAGADAGQAQTTSPKAPVAPPAPLLSPGGPAAPVPAPKDPNGTTTPPKIDAVAPGQGEPDPSPAVSPDNPSGSEPWSDEEKKTSRPAKGVSEPGPARPEDKAPQKPPAATAKPNAPETTLQQPADPSFSVHAAPAAEGKPAVPLSPVSDSANPTVPGSPAPPAEGGEPEGGAKNQHSGSQSWSGQGGGQGEKNPAAPAFSAQPGFRGPEKAAGDRPPAFAAASPATGTGLDRTLAAVKEVQAGRSAALAEQIAARLATLSPGGTVTVTLEPAELGTVLVRFTRQGSNWKIQVIPERPEAAGILAPELPRLEALLARMHDPVKVDISLGGEGRSGGQDAAETPDRSAGHSPKATGLPVGSAPATAKSAPLAETFLTPRRLDILT